MILYILKNINMVLSYVWKSQCHSLDYCAGGADVLHLFCPRVHKTEPAACVMNDPSFNFNL